MGTNNSINTTDVTVATNGQLLVGSTGAAPVLAVLASADSSVTITNTAGAIDLAAEGGYDTNFTGDSLQGDGFYSPLNAGNTSNSMNNTGPATNRQLFTKLLIGKSVTPTQLCMSVSINAGSSNLRWGIYSDSDFAPGTLLWQSDELDSSTTGLKWTAVTGLTLDAGVYWVGMVTDNDSVRVRSLTGCPTLMYTGTDFIPSYTAVEIDYNYGSLSSSPTLTNVGFENQRAPCVLYQLT